MGHKRKKLSERVADKKMIGFDLSPFKNVASDTPKGFQRIMWKKESISKKQEEKRALEKGQSIESTTNNNNSDKNKKKPSANNNSNIHNPNNKNQKPDPKDELRIKPGEKMGEFSRRVDDHMRGKMMKTSKDNSAQGSKKKKYYEKLKAKEQEKKLKKQEEAAYEDYERLVDKVKLNDVVEAPPQLTAIPKRRRNDEFMANKKWKNTPGEEDLDDVIDDSLDQKKKKKILEDAKDPEPTTKKSRMKNMTPAGRRILEEERKQAIERYRMAKVRQALERGPRRGGGEAEADDGDDAAAEAAGY